MKNSEIPLTNPDIIRIRQMMRNPALLTQIQDKILALEERGFVTQTYKENIKTKPQEVINMILDQYRESPVYTEFVVGKETMELIKEFMMMK